jgi:hypothetical protein
MFLGVFLDPDIHCQWVAEFRFAAPLHRLTTQTNLFKRITDSFSEEGAGFSVSGFGIDLVCSGLKSERDTPFPRFLPSAGPEAKLGRRPDRGKTGEKLGRRPDRFEP